MYPSVFVPPATCTWKCRFGAARRFGNIDMTFHELKLRWAKWVTSDLTTNMTTCASYKHQPSAILPCQQPLPGVQCWSSPRKGLKDPHVLHHRCFSKHPLRWDLQAPWKTGSKIAKASSHFPVSRQVVNGWELGVCSISSLRRWSLVQCTVSPDWKGRSLRIKKMPWIYNFIDWAMLLALSIQHSGYHMLCGCCYFSTSLEHVKDLPSRQAKTQITTTFRLCCVSFIIFHPLHTKKNHITNSFFRFVGATNLPPTFQGSQLPNRTSEPSASLHQATVPVPCVSMALTLEGSNCASVSAIKITAWMGIFSLFLGDVRDDNEGILKGSWRTKKWKLQHMKKYKCYKV